MVWGHSRQNKTRQNKTPIKNQVTAHAQEELILNFELKKSAKGQLLKNGSVAILSETEKER